MIEEQADVEPLAVAPSVELQAAQLARLDATWARPQGWRVFSDVNNSVVGWWYTTTSFAFFLFGGVLALIMRVQLATPNNTFLNADQYNQIFTMHGTVMMFLFAVPILESISILLLPAMMGARDLPFPRLSAYGYWCFLIGGVFVCGSLFFNAAPKGGWFMYPPLTTEYQTGIGADIWLLGLSFIEIASIAAAVELIVGVLKCRPPGMRLNLIPLYSWYILVVGIMILFAFPPLIAGDVLLEMERAFDWPFFDDSRGGDPLLWQHLFWIFGHPEVYIVFLPSIALVAMIVPTFARTPMVGYGWIVLAAVGTGFLSFGLWVHHMFTTGLPGISLGIFSAASEAVAIPTGIQLFCFIATLMVGRVQKTISMTFVLAGLATFVMGGLTGVMVAIAPFDFQAHDSYFIVGHLHYVLIGGTIFPITAGIYYYYPLILGYTLSERLGRIVFWLMFVGFNVSFFPMHLTGLVGMPRRVYIYQSGLGFDTLNMISSIGAFVLGAGFLVLLWDLFRPKAKEPYAARNPWGGGTLEWLANAPPIQTWGVRSIPEIDSRYPLWDQANFVRDVDEGRFYLPDAEEGLRETLVTSVMDAKPVQCLRVGGPTYLPMLAAVFTGGVFIIGTYHLWIPAAISGVFAIATIWWWLWTGTAQIPEKDFKDVGLGCTLPIYVSGPASVGWWAMFITMLGDATAFASLVFGYFYYWTIHEEFPPKESSSLGWHHAVGALVCALVAWVMTIAARSLNRRNSASGFYLSMLIAIAASVATVGWLSYAPIAANMDPTHHAYEAIVWVLIGWTAVHVLLGTLMLCYCFARRVAGRMTEKYDADITNVTLFWHFVIITAIVTVMVVAGFPLVNR